MNLRLNIIRIAGLILAFASGNVHGQELRLKEADILRLIPLLRAEAAGLRAAQGFSERQTAAQTDFPGDPLEFFNSRAKIALPQDARYMAGCSRSASAGGPVAIFTFGRNIDCYERTRRDAFKDGPPKTEPAISKECSLEREQTRKFMQGVKESMKKRGFLESAGFCPDECLDSADGLFRIFLTRHNIYDRANRLDDHPLIRIENDEAREKAMAACSDMPSGPIIEVRPGDRFFEKEPVNTLETALHQAGLTATEYDAMKEALFLARMDMQPQWLKAAEAAADNDLAALQALTIRRGNADLYRKLAAELDPLLDALVPK
jgi:hypothetical protein